MTTVAEFYSDPHIGLRFGVKNESHTTPMGHSGQDFNGWSYGTWIPNIAAGRVVRKVTDEQNPNDLGNYIVIECRINGIRYFITYCHLASFGGTPSVGQTVGFGQGVGPIGDTGYSLGVHLHMMASAESMYPNARVWLVDPLPLVLSCRSGTAGGDVTPFPPEPTPEPEPIPEEEEDEMPKNTGVWYLNDSGKAVALIHNTGSGYQHEFSASGATLDPTLVAKMKLAYDMPEASWPDITKAHADNIKDGLAAVRASGGATVTIASPVYTADLTSDGVPGKITGTLTPEQ